MFEVEPLVDGENGAVSCLPGAHGFVFAKPKPAKREDKVAAFRRGFYSAGFTMIELVVVIVLIGIMAVAAMPRLSYLMAFNDSGYRDQLKAVFNYARKTAIAQRRDTCVTIVVPGSPNTVTVTRGLVNHGGCTTSLLLPASSSNSIKAPSNVTASAVAVEFDGEGNPWNPGTWSATIPPTFPKTFVTVTDNGSASSSTLTIETSGYVH